MTGGSEGSKNFTLNDYNVNPRLTSGGNGGNAAKSGSAGNVYSTNAIWVNATPDAKYYTIDGQESGRNYAYPLDECKITIDESDSATLGPDGKAFKYTSKEVKPKVTITHIPTGYTVPTTAYNVTYSNDINAGTANIKITGSGDRYNLVTSSNTSATYSATYQIKYDAKDFEVVYTDFLTCSVTKGETNPVDVVPSSTATNAAYRYTGSAVEEGKLALKNDHNVVLDTSNYVRTCSNNTAVTNSAKTSIVINQNNDSWFEDSWGEVREGTFSIMSTPVITTESKTYLDVYPNTPYELQLDVSNPNAAPYDGLYWKVDTGSLPGGLTLDENTGLISGTPPEDLKDAVAIIKVYNLAGWSNSVTCTWKVAAIQGKATTAAGVPCSNVAVKVVDKEKLNLNLGEAITDKNGSYNIPTIPNRPRDVVVQFSTTADASGRPQRVVEGQQSKTINVPDSAESARCDVSIEQATQVTFKVNEHAVFSGNSSTLSQYGYTGDALNTPSLASIDKGWKVVSWKDANGDEPTTVYPSEDTTYVATLEEGTYTVKYDAAGGSKTSGDSYADWSGKFEEGASDDPTKQILPYQNPIRLGYKFVNWHLLGNENLVVTDKTTYEDLVDGNESIMSATVVAKWEVRDDIKVTLDANGTSGAPATVDGGATKVYENQSTGEVIDYAAPVRAGYTFKGWSQKRLASEAIGDYAPIMSLTVPGIKEEESEVTFYALWEANKIGVEFNTMKGTSASTDLTFSGNPGETYDVPADPTRTGYTFKGWFKSPTLNSESYAAKSLGTIPSENTIYYAQWELRESRSH